jgi:LmbE family N-acetylglucosaminyl deacetylase
MQELESKKSKSILVVAAHHDDEVLGCGATLAKHKANGDTVRVLFLADGVSSRGTDTDENRTTNADRAKEVLGLHGITSLTFPDNKLDSVPLLDIVQMIEKEIKSVKPDIIYTHHFGDLNVDHQVAHRAVMTACRPQPGFPVKKILSFEVPSSTEWISASMGNSFVPNYYIDVTEFVEKKMDALECYKDEMREYPHSRSFKNVTNMLAFRGATVGYEAAEAFIVERILVD